jgi:hypothetical protein
MRILYWKLRNSVFHLFYCMNRDDSGPGFTIFDKGTITPQSIIEMHIKEIGKLPCKTGSRRCIVPRPMYKEVINKIYQGLKPRL